jgi:tRNA nucleotidyltransferase (CCA-adding enzyme)
MKIDIKLTDGIRAALLNINISGGTPYIVGGTARDAVMRKYGMPCSDSLDLDFEVFGIHPDNLKDALSSVCGEDIDEIGKSFGILSVRIDEIQCDFSVPRRERKSGPLHTDFDIELDANMKMGEAMSRRDFTMNALYIDPFTGEVFDRYGGVTDIKNGMIRPTSARFEEDPLRVLRAFQFIGRFGLGWTSEFTDVCFALKETMQSIPRERVWKEFYKWATLSRYPGRALHFLAESGWMLNFEELVNIDGLEQDQFWHPEGDVLVHTIMVCDEALKVCDDMKIRGMERAEVMFGALCHDFGKASTTESGPDGRIHSYGHAQSGFGPAEMFMVRIGAPTDVSEIVANLTSEHMFYADMYKTGVSRRAIRRLASRLKEYNIKPELLIAVCMSDVMGRAKVDYTNVDIIKKSLDEIKDVKEKNEIEPLLMGRDLIDLGFKPGPTFGSVLLQVYNMQLDGAVQTKADAIELGDKLMHSEIINTEINGKELR